MTYPELGRLDSTPDQDLGLTIAFKMAVNAKQTTATTPGEYLVERVQEWLTNESQRWVLGEKLVRLQQAISTALASKDAAVDVAAQALGVDLTVDVPADKTEEKLK